MKGEKYFRKIEEVEGLNIIKGDRKIIALGGGSFINQKIRNEIEKSSFSVWLDVAPEEIFNRIKKNKARPLLINAKSVEDVEKIYLNRKKYMHWQIID